MVERACLRSVCVRERQQPGHREGRVRTRICSVSATARLRDSRKSVRPFILLSATARSAQGGTKAQRKGGRRDRRGEDGPKAVTSSKCRTTQHVVSSPGAKRACTMAGVIAQTAQRACTRERGCACCDPALQPSCLHSQQWLTLYSDRPESSFWPPALILLSEDTHN